MSKLLALKKSVSFFSRVFLLARPTAGQYVNGLWQGENYAPTVEIKGHITPLPARMNFVEDEGTRMSAKMQITTLERIYLNGERKNTGADVIIDNKNNRTYKAIKILNYLELSGFQKTVLELLPEGI